jgi:hypothetical protein
MMVGPFWFGSRVANWLPIPGGHDDLLLVFVCDGYLFSDNMPLPVSVQAFGSSRSWLAGDLRVQELFGHLV